MKISIVTATFNSKKNIERCLNSLWAQSFTNVEHICIDGASTDGTLEYLSKNKYRIDRLVSEPDSGIYEALNKGFMLATGDVVGILHSDDQYANEKILEIVSRAFENPNIDYVYGDIYMINFNGVVKRHWIPGELVDGKITSNQIPHPALFVSRKLLDRCNPPFDSSYRIAADLKHQLIIANIIGARGKYISIPFVKMQLGGTSTSGLIAYILGWIESRRAWNEVHGRGGLLFVCKKVLSKIFNYRRD